MWGGMNVNDREFRLFLSYSETFDTSGCGFGFEFAFFYCQCWNPLVQRIPTSDSEGFVDQENHSNLFNSFSVEEKTFKEAVCIFFN